MQSAFFASLQRLALALLTVAALLCQSAYGASCEETTERYAFAVRAGPLDNLHPADPLGDRVVEIYGEHSFYQRVPNGWVFALESRPAGWYLTVYDSGARNEAVDLTAITPPYHGPANAREISGWHFRNADNTAPNTGDVNAPQRMRLFFFDPALTGTGGFKPPRPSGEAALPSPDDTGRGALQILDFGLSDLIPGKRARMNYLKFSACLTWPKSAAQMQHEADQASPDYVDEEVEIIGRCGLDLATFRLEARVLPRSLGFDIDGDDSLDEIFQAVRINDGRRILALCRAGTWLHLIGGNDGNDNSGVGAIVQSMEAWRFVARDHGRFGYVGEPEWPEADGDILVVERIEKAMALVYWQDGALRGQPVYRYIEP